MSKRKISIFDILNICILGLIGILILYPFYNSIMMSFLTVKEYSAFNSGFFPKEFTLDAYKLIFKDGWVWTGYRNSVFIAAVGTLYSLFLTTTCAYGFSKKSFTGKKLLMSIFVFTMFFSGGIIPLYILIKSLGLMNHLWSIILPSGMSAFYMLLMRNYFESIDESIKESARLDGAGEAMILFRFILPMSMPILATIGLFTIVDYWNAWYTPMLFLKTVDKKPLQLFLREIIAQMNTRITDLITNDSLHKDTQYNVNGQIVQMAAVVVTMAPITLVYPFLQKYFVKGIMIGSVKG